MMMIMVMLVMVMMMVVDYDDGTLVVVLGMQLHACFVLLLAMQSLPFRVLA